MDDLVARYEALLPIYIDREGFRAPPLLAVHDNGNVSMASMHIPQEDIFTVAHQRFIADPTIKEVIFGVDRYTKPGQGTRYKDVLTVFWWQRDRIENSGFKFGVINYRPPPQRIIEPIDWCNAFWNGVMQKIVDESSERMQRNIQRLIDTGRGDLVEQALETVREMREFGQSGRKPS